MIGRKHIKSSIISAVVLAAFIGVGASVGTRGNTEGPIHASVDERRGPHDCGDDFEGGGIGEEVGRRLGKGSTLSPSKRPTASPTDAPTDEPTTGSPSGSPTTPSPTDCEHGRKWHANEDATKCTNAHLPDGSLDVDCDEWDTVTECCEQLFIGPGEPCKVEDVCNTSMPTTSPTANPSASPTPAPSRRPSRQPTRRPSNKPSMRPTAKPSRKPSMQPTPDPTAKPSAEPSAQPSTQPTVSPSTPAPTTASPSPAPTLSPVTPFPTTTTPTWMPTSCAGRQWYIISGNSGVEQCTNGYDIPDGYDRGWDFYDSRDECCQLEFGAGNCDFLDACEPTASPTTSPTTPAPTTCASLPWKLLNGKCTNDLESVSNDEGHSLYSSAEECCVEEFEGDACNIDDICVSDTPTAAPTPEATQGSTPTVGKGAEFEEDTPLGPRVGSRRGLRAAAY